MYRWQYHTADELQWLRKLAVSHPDRFRRYARLVLADCRGYDSTIHVPTVRAETARLLAALPTPAP